MTRVSALLFLCLLTVTAWAKIVPPRDPLDGVLDAELVVIVSPELEAKPGVFRIGEALLGDLHAGDTIELRDFKLSVIQEYGPEVVDPISPATRILLYLEREKDPIFPWKVTYSEKSFFWVQRTEEVALLRRAAERTIELRRQWERAANIPDARQRVISLWPYLSTSTYGLSFFEHTMARLKKARPASGEYFAEHYDEMSHNQRMMLLPDAGELGSDRLHEKLKQDIVRQEHVYMEFAEVPGKSTSDGTVSERARDASGEIYYALAGLAKYGDRGDLPFFREAAVWSAKNHLEQAASAAVNAFRDMPDVANVPTIEYLLRVFLPGRMPGMSIIDWDAERALCRHRHPETIPLLESLGRDSNQALAREARSCVAEIIGLEPK